eukprot:COSAG06_NODE_2034_length_7781_cov_9.499089_4_plen_153_part_00
MAVGALTKSCAKVSTCLMALRCKSSLPCQCTAHTCTSCLQMLDCTSNPDGTITLDTMPDMICWEGNHSVFAAMGAAGLLAYSVLVPAKLFLTVKGSAADGEWTVEELESHGWLLLKVSTAQSSRPVVWLARLTRLRPLWCDVRAVQAKPLVV